MNCYICGNDLYTEYEVEHKMCKCCIAGATVLHILDMPNTICTIQCEQCSVFLGKLK